MTRTPADEAGAKLRRMIETCRKNISAAARRARSNMMSHNMARAGRFIFSLEALA